MKSTHLSISAQHCINHLIAVVVVTVAVAVAVAADDDDPIQYTPVVKLANGKVQGKVVEIESIGKVRLYEGIRYARAERFQKPVPVEPWFDVYNATSWRNACPQPVYEHTDVKGLQTESLSEDCLFLNVWTPIDNSTDTGTATNKTVMFWIHGGGYTVGTIFSVIYNGDFMTHLGDVVVVTINYRLGPFGFLYGGADQAPGNVGLYDQLAALHWVQQNIVHFGGNPNQVVVFGESAGAFSIGLLIVSPLAKGLFHRAILQSGGPSSANALNTKEKALQKTKELAKKVNCSTTESIVTMIDCLKHMPMDALVNNTSTNFLTNDIFTPIYGDELLPLKPTKALQMGKFNKNIDLLFGVTSNEGAFFVVDQFPELLSSNETLPLDSVKKDILELAQIRNISYGEEVANFYLSKLSSNSTLDEKKITISEIYGDYILVCPTILFGEQLAQISPSNRYYTYRLMQRYENPLMKYQPWMGVMHGDDLIYLFAYLFTRWIPEHEQMSRDMISTWTSFARTGKPGRLGSIEWIPAFSGGSLDKVTEPVTVNHMELKVGHYRIVNNLYRDRCDHFWKAKLT